MTRTGLFFGSFNPIHIGHLAIAGFMKEFESLDEIYFVISPRNPFKSPHQLVSPAARLEMTRLALKQYPAFFASDIEFDMPRPSYTIKTLEKLTTEYPGKDFHIIIGTDNIGSIGQWREGKALKENYNFLFYPRHGTAETTASGEFRNGRLVPAPLIEISSTFIRDSIKQGKNMRAFVPSETYDFIERNRYYASEQ